MSDLRPEELDQAERSSLPPDLLVIHDRLVGDGARWRWRTPDGVALAQRTRASLTAELDMPELRVAPPTAEQSPAGASFRIDQQPDFGPRGLHTDMTSTPMARIRSFLGVAAAVAIVGMIALLLTHNAGKHNSGTGGDTATATPKSTPADTSQPASTGAFMQPDQFPVVAPSDPSVVYKLASGALQRSSDGGKTYTSEALPTTDLSRVDTMSVAVSPLDPTHVFVTMSGPKAGTDCMPSAPYPAITLHGGILASGFVPCGEQYVSVNSGHTWTQPHLPYNAVLGGTSMMRGSTGAMDDMQYAIKASGTRLYAAMALSDMAGSLIDSPGVRLIASDDGGLTWSLVDTSLATTSRLVCDFGVSSATPTVLYAVTEGSSCSNESFPSMNLWTSHDGGQNWSQVRTLPTQQETGVFVTDNGKLLYMILPQVAVQGHGANITTAPADIHVSMDGGATFQSAPAAGLPASPSLSGPYAVLADGSVVIGAAKSDSTGAPGPISLYSWKPGATSWTKVGGAEPAGVVAVVPLAPAPGAQRQTLIITDYSGTVSTVTAPLGS